MSDDTGGQNQLTILLVEDEPLISLTICDILEELGHRVLESVSATEAMKMFEAEAVIDLLITDIGLPDMQGDALARKLRQSRPDLPVLFSTGRMASAGSADDLLAPPCEQLSKPFLMHDLQSAIERLTQRSS
jgi:CheY-like chemotaxis protein